MKIDSRTREIIEKQFYLDCNLAEAEEIKAGEIYLSKSKKLPGARIVSKTDLFFRAIMYGGKAYLMVDESIYDGCKEIFKDVEADWFCKFPNLRLIDNILQEYGYEIADTHIYYLPDETFPHVEENYPVVWYDEKAIELRKEWNTFSNALCYSETQPDIMAVVAINDGNSLVESEMGMAGCSLDGKYTRQIGVDVKPEFRGKGLATYLTSLLKQKIMKQAEENNEEVIPFYGTSESHSLSRSVAIQSGFLPAWCEIQIRKKEA